MRDDKRWRSAKKVSYTDIFWFPHRILLCVARNASSGESSLQYLRYDKCNSLIFCMIIYKLLYFLSRDDYSDNQLLPQPTAPATDISFKPRQWGSLSWKYKEPYIIFMGEEYTRRRRGRLVNLLGGTSITNAAAKNMFLVTMVTVACV